MFFIFTILWHLGSFPFITPDLQLRFKHLLKLKVFFPKLWLFYCYFLLWIIFKHLFMLMRWEIRVMLLKLVMLLLPPVNLLILVLTHLLLTMLLNLLNWLDKIFRVFFLFRMLISFNLIIHALIWTCRWIHLLVSRLFWANMNLFNVSRNPIIWWQHWFHAGFTAVRSVLVMSNLNWITNLINFVWIKTPKQVFPCSTIPLLRWG